MTLRFLSYRKYHNHDRHRHRTHRNTQRETDGKIIFHYVSNILNKNKGIFFGIFLRRELKQKPIHQFK